MNAHRLLIAATSLALATGALTLATVAVAQGAPTGAAQPGAATGAAATGTESRATGNPANAAGVIPPTANPANSAGVIPPTPPVPGPAVTANNPDGSQPGFFRPAPDAIAVPPFTPTTPGIIPMDTPTNAIVGSSQADRELRDSIAAAIAADPQMLGASINVLVSDGAVTLSGTARDPAQAERARAITERLAGSAQVTSAITTG